MKEVYGYWARAYYNYGNDLDWDVTNRGIHIINKTNKFLFSDSNCCVKDILKKDRFVIYFNNTNIAILLRKWCKE